MKRLFTVACCNTVKKVNGADLENNVVTDYLIRCIKSINRHYPNDLVVLGENSSTHDGFQRLDLDRLSDLKFEYHYNNPGCYELGALHAAYELVEFKDFDQIVLLQDTIEIRKPTIPDISWAMDAWHGDNGFPVGGPAANFINDSCILMGMKTRHVNRTKLWIGCVNGVTSRFYTYLYDRGFYRCRPSEKDHSRASERMLAMLWDEWIMETDSHEKRLLSLKHDRIHEVMYKTWLDRE